MRAWSTVRTRLLSFAWKLREWLTERGVEHTVVLLKCREDHFLCDRADHVLSPTDDQSTEPQWPQLSWVHRSLTALARRVKNAKPGVDARPTCSLFESCQIHGLDFANDWNPKELSDAEGHEKRRALRSYRACAKFEARQKDRVRFIDDHVRAPLYKRAKCLTKDDKDTELREWMEKTLSQSILDQEPPLGIKRPITIGNLTLVDLDEWFDDDERTDQFVAFVCADGDGMGQLFTGLDWNVEAWGDQGDANGFGKLLPWQRNRHFSKALDDVIREAFVSAAAEVTLSDKEALESLKKDYGERIPFVIPVLPQIQGGDDLWTIARRDVALQLCRLFAANVQCGIRESSIIQKGMEISKRNSGETASLSMSQGIAFAKAGHPVHAMVEAAESMLDSAKTLRKGQAWKRCKPEEGCIDWHWIESSLSETVEDARAEGAAYVAPDTRDVMLLTTRPWTQTEAEQLECAARCFKEGVPRRKREQLEDILRRGHVLSLAAWDGWWNQLTSHQREAVVAAIESASCALSDTWPCGDSPDSSYPNRAKTPWRYVGKEEDEKGTKHYYVTPLLDLLALEHLEASRSTGGKAHV